MDERCINLRGILTKSLGVLMVEITQELIERLATEEVLNISFDSRILGRIDVTTEGGYTITATLINIVSQEEKMELLRENIRLRSDELKLMEAELDAYETLIQNRPHP